MELKVKEAEQEYNLEGQLIKYVASGEPTPINTAQYEPNHSLIITSHPFCGAICHSSSRRQGQLNVLHTQMDWPGSGLMVVFAAVIKAARPLHGGQHHASDELAKWMGEQLWGGR